MTVLVTGGTGFIGSHLVGELVKRGETSPSSVEARVRVLARKTSDTSGIEGPGVEIVSGDLLDADSLASAIDGCHTLYHTAALFARWVPGKMKQAMYAINVEGTRNVLNAALRAGVSKVVYTSSRATIGPSEPDRLADEQTPWRSELPDDYMKSKLLAEREALKICAQGLPVVIVNPTFVIGPGRPSPSGQAIVDFLNNRFPGYIEHHENFVYVKDVVKGHILAREKGRVGERYILGGENLSIREFLDLLEEVSGVRAPRLRFPYLPALLAGYLYEALARVTRTTPPFTVGFIKETKTDMRCDISKAKRELGYETTPIREAFRITVEWLRENEYASRQ